MKNLFFRILFLGIVLLLSNGCGDRIHDIPRSIEKMIDDNADDISYVDKYQYCEEDYFLFYVKDFSSSDGGYVAAIYDSDGYVIGLASNSISGTASWSKNIVEFRSDAQFVMTIWKNGKWMI